MLRHPRRDRFAPMNPEREQREAAFANGDTNIPGGIPEGNEERQEYKKVTPDTRTVLERISAGTYLSAEATLSIEHREKIHASPLVLDALSDIAHPSAHVEGILQSAMEKVGIPSITDESASNSIAAWHNEQREKKVVLDEDIAKARAEILRNVTDDPETLLALIRSLEDQRKRYREFIENVDSLDPEGKPVDPAARTSVEAMIKKFADPAIQDASVTIPKQSQSSESQIKHSVLTRADTAQSIQSLIKLHGQASVEQWLRQARTEEIRYMLDIKDPDSPSALRRGINLLSDWSKRITFSMFRWNAEDRQPDDAEKRTKQSDYFAEMEKHITGLKGILKEKLEERANHLSKRVDEEMRKGLSEAAKQGIGIEDITKVSASQFDGEIAERFEKDHFITLEDAIEEMNATVARLKQSRGLTIHSNDFIDRASDALERIDELSETNVPDLWKHAISEAQRRHKEVQSWIPDFLKRYNAIRPKLDDEKSASFIAMSTGAKDGAEVRTRLDELAAMLRNPSALDRSELSYIQGTVFRLLPAIEGLLSRNYQRAFALPLHASTPSEFSAHSETVSNQITSIETLLAQSRIQNSDACRTAGIPQKLGEQMHSARGNLLQAGTSFEKSRQSLEALPPNAPAEERNRLESILRAACGQVEAVRVEMEELRKALEFIKTLPTKAEDTDAAVDGYCDYGKTKIYVNRQRHTSDEAAQRTFDHEFGHLVIDTLTERHFVMTGTFDKQQSEIEKVAAERGPSGEDSVEQMLETAARQWALDREKITADGTLIDAPGGGEAYYRRKRWEELLMQYATYRSKSEDTEYDVEKDKEYTPIVRGLFNLLDAQTIQRDDPSKPADDLRNTLLAKRTALAFLTGDEDDEDGGENEVDPNAPATERIARQEAPTETPLSREALKGPTLEDFTKLRKSIKVIHEYFHSYPVKEAGGLGDLYQNAKEGYDQYFRQFNEHIRAYSDHEHMPEPYVPENDADLGRIIAQANSVLDSELKVIKDFDTMKMEAVNDAKPEGKEFWLWFTRDIQWLSIMDYWTMAKEGWEDVQRLWKRRGENARGKVGELLTGWINDKVPYFGQLKHEFHRRQQSSEQEAVGVWEKALENVDSYALIDQIPHVNNPDHLKAVMVLLTKRGRLDWDDPKLWKALSRFSHFKIPEKECHRDPVLLDKWLQKIIADIWTDKDLYRTWKTTNEHSYDSERDKYAGVADYFSSNGLLAPQLEYMLKTFVIAKDKRDNGENVPIPDQVNPHLYEELFLYAMERGKMSMEQKFFFLIQGLRYKLIPFDRLAILNSKISTETFPFIDFFYQRNNAVWEIEEMGKSIQERDNPFQAGKKTTAFLLEEVAKDEAMRQRAFKVISRKGNQLDHEDIPFLMGIADAGSLDELLIVSSGQLQRVTPEGLKNAYVGYNDVFKVHAMQAEKRGSLSPQDIDFLSSRLSAFVHYDNIVARKAHNTPNRPSLSFEAINNQTMPSGDGKKPRQFRDPMLKLVDRVFIAYQDVILNELSHSPHIDSASGETSQTFLKNYLGVDALTNERKRSEEQFTPGKEAAARVWSMGSKMPGILQKAIQSDDGDRFVRILKEMKEDFVNQGETQYKFMDMQEFVGRQSRFEHANGGGNGHGGGH
ncbi:MAG: hypothetical protein Greene101449_1056 [Candidatus Peregrinibacteria bacterium Greene1014_49]|nr:MAG: hypothetical protein Greene101449_1056 [Candidatus Peregrinibacteria bacterium Greene1014_49]